MSRTPPTRNPVLPFADSCFRGWHAAVVAQPAVWDWCASRHGALTQTRLVDNTTRPPPVADTTTTTVPSCSSSHVAGSGPFQPDAGCAAIGLTDDLP